ncbi:MAG: hypothetical protein GY841_15945 [FCB group bacterium]|nr:hypothetical protein [FCB group bacterium]
MKRRVEYFEWQKQAGEITLKKVKKGEATFHQFGIDFMEVDTGCGQFTTAVIELDDGTVLNVAAETIRFLEG